MIIYTQGSITLSSTRPTSAYASDLSDIIEAIAEDSHDYLVCSCSNTEAIDALEDGEYLASFDADQDAVEQLYDLLTK